MKMRLKSGQKLFLSIFVIVFCMTIPILFSHVFAAGTETWYTDFKLTSPASVSTSSGETTGSYTRSLTNYDTDVIEGEFYFVDAVPLLSEYYACKADGQNEIFGRYLHMEGNGNTTFSVQPGQTITGIIEFEFPESYSGTYHGCIVYSTRDDSGNGDTVTNMSSRKAIPVQVTLQASEVRVHIVANLGSRRNANTLNFKGYESRGKLLFYPQNHNPNDMPIASGYVIMDHEGNGELIGVSVLADTYDVVYKSRQHLASYIPNVTINGGDNLDFVQYAIGVGEVSNHDEHLKYNSGWTYQIAGDMPRSTNDYDNVINGTDLSVLWGSRCPYMQYVSTGHICDLNNDGRVDSTDASVILANKNAVDTAYYAGEFTGFGYVDYFDYSYYDHH